LGEPLLSLVDSPSLFHAFNSGRGGRMKNKRLFSKLAKELDKNHSSIRGWTFKLVRDKEFCHFCYEHKGLKKRVYFTPDLNVNRTIDIQVMTRDNNVLALPPEVPYHEPLTAEQMVKAVKPWLTQAETSWRAT
jgi:hypothetical protein